MSIKETQIIDVNHLATFGHASGEALRLQILRALSRDSFGVLELCQIFATKQPSLSHHLKVLANAGLVTTRREGNSIFYRRAPLPKDEVFNALHGALWTAVDATELPEECAARLNEVNEVRAEKSKAFFRDHAGHFHSHQEQIASVELYTKEVMTAIEKYCQTSGLAAEIGPGEGQFLPYLADHFNQLIALDSSAEMLALAQEYGNKQRLNNVTWVNGDTSALTTFDDGLDCQVINMVLHHVASPQKIFDDCYAAAKPGGVLIISDLCEHDQTWAKDACGDLWLGLNSDDILLWADHAGWKNIESSYFAQRNGFTIQLHCFNKTDMRSQHEPFSPAKLGN